MRAITLDFTNCKNCSELHTTLKKVFGFPDYYGENLDALWDCLDYWYDENVHITIKGLEKLASNLDKEVEGMLEIFNDVHKNTPNVTFEISEE